MTYSPLPKSLNLGGATQTGRREAVFAWRRRIRHLRGADVRCRRTQSMPSDKRRRTSGRQTGQMKTAVASEVKVNGSDSAHLTSHRRLFGPRRPVEILAKSVSRKIRVALVCRRDPNKIRPISSLPGAARGWNDGGCSPGGISWRPTSTEHLAVTNWLPWLTVARRCKGCHADTSENISLPLNLHKVDFCTARISGILGPVSTPNIPSPPL